MLNYLSEKKKCFFHKTIATELIPIAPNTTFQNITQDKKIRNDPKSHTLSSFINSQVPE